MLNRTNLQVAALSFALGALAPVIGAMALTEVNGLPATEVRLIGMCDGKLLAAKEEDNFPETGCAWIEPVRF